LILHIGCRLDYLRHFQSKTSKRYLQHRATTYYFYRSTELSSCKTKRARLLLALAARNLAESDFAGDDSPEADSPNIGTMYEDDWAARQHASTDAAANNDSTNRDRSKQNPNSDQPPDDRKRPEHLSSIRPAGVCGLKRQFPEAKAAVSVVQRKNAPTKWEE
jgi:hypothetical protein